MGTKNDPGQFDCLDTALPDEPVFVLLGRDTQAPGLVHMWAFEREQGIAEGRFPESDRAKVAEALRLATQMIEWRQRNDGAWREKNPELPLTAEPAPLCACEQVHEGLAATGPLCDHCVRDGEQVREGFLFNAIAALNRYVATMRAPRFMDDVPGSVLALTDPFPEPRRFADDFAINLHKPRTADTADAASAMRSGPDYPEL